MNQNGFQPLHPAGGNLQPFFNNAPGAYSEQSFNNTPVANNFHLANPTTGLMVPSRSNLGRSAQTPRPQMPAQRCQMQKRSLDPHSASNRNAKRVCLHEEQQILVKDPVGPIQYRTSTGHLIRAANAPVPQHSFLHKSTEMNMLPSGSANQPCFTTAKFCKKIAMAGIRARDEALKLVQYLQQKHIQKQQQRLQQKQAAQSSVNDSPSSLLPQTKVQTSITASPLALPEQFRGIHSFQLQWSAPVREELMPKTFTLPPKGILHMFECDHKNVGGYLKYLEKLSTPLESFLPEDMEEVRCAPEENLGDLNKDLHGLFSQGERKVLFRKMVTPGRENTSVLAQCIRYAQSEAQQDVGWSVHPDHVALIRERTNEYGVERRESKVKPVEEKLDLSEGQQMEILLADLQTTPAEEQ